MNALDEACMRKALAEAEKAFSENELKSIPAMLAYNKQAKK